MRLEAGEGDDTKWLRIPLLSRKGYDLAHPGEVVRKSPLELARKEYELEPPGGGRRLLARSTRHVARRKE